MKQKVFITLIFILAFLSLTARPVFAADVAGSAAELAYHTPVAVPDGRVARLQAFLATYNSPLADEAKTFIEEADRNNLDWKLVAAIAGVESTFGKQIPTGSFNAWGWGIPTGAQSGIGFQSWGEGIATVSEGLAKNYFGRGAKNLYDVGWIYAANGNSWGNHVTFFIDKITAFTPAAPSQLAVSI